MDDKYRQILELPKVLSRLTAHADFSASKQLAVGLTPTSSLERARQRMAETSEARRLLAEHPDTSVRGARDVRESVRGAERGVVLEPAEMLDIQSTLNAARRLRRLLQKYEAEYPLLAKEAAQIREAQGLIRAIGLTVDDQGEVLDSASAELERIRKDSRVAHERLNDKLSGLINNPSVARMLQEPIITQREGRFVVPLRAEFKGQLKAVVHDQSTSGATLFVEPLPAVDLNNEIRELELAERDEVRRILAELSSWIGKQAEDITIAVETLARLDLAFAKSRLAEEQEAQAPQLKGFDDRPDMNHPGSCMRLLGARHPLLDPESVVPIDVTLDDDIFALVVTGPNTGGKTVALKTVGLLAIMAQSGLHIPAESGSALSVFDHILADIGDEQSIEQSLSTFSAHIANIIRILDSAGSRSLVLLDELGAGTDPQEGSALARAILNVLINSQITTLVASHYPELKSYAHVTPGVRNASVEFDLETLRPTYRLTVGLPGRSNALAIAEQLGLDMDVIRAARALLDPDEVRAEGLLDEIRAQRDAAQRAREEMEAAEAAAKQLREDLSSRLDSIEDDRRELLTTAKAEFEAELEDLREDLETLRRRLTLAGEPLEEAQVIAQDLAEIEGQAEETLADTPVAETIDPGLVEPGDRVRLPNLGMDGEITHVGEAEVEVQIGRLRIRAGLEEIKVIRDARGEIQEASESSSGAQVRRSTSHRVDVEPPAMELDLRGMRVAEALEAVERRLDSAFLAGLPFIRVIHGKGTGRLREAVREALRGSPYVASARPGERGEGGDGVTVVDLSND